MRSLQNILKTELRKYVGSGWRTYSRLFLICDDQHKIYSVTQVNVPRTADPATVLILARIVGNTIIIEEDQTQKKLVNVLLQRGIAAERLVLNYIEDTPEEVYTD